MRNWFSSDKGGSWIQGTAKHECDPTRAPHDGPSLTQPAPAWLHGHLEAGVGEDGQGLGLLAFPAAGPGSISGWGTKIPQAAWLSPPPPKKQTAQMNLYFR